LMTDLAAAYADARVLILGGLGLIGSTLAHRLVTLGARVTILDARLAAYGANPKNLDGIADRISLEIGDIRDELVMRRLVPGQACIVNLAAQVSYNDSLSDPFLDLDINCRGHLLLLELCRRLNPEARVLFAGSRLQFGRIERVPTDED